MSEPVFASPLGHRSDRLDGLAISLVELTDIGMIDLRGRADDALFAKAVHRCLGLDLPTIPRQSTTRDQVTLLWLSPDQWLALVPRNEAPALAAALQAETAATHALICDVSDMRAIIRLGGEGVREVLAKGTAANLFTAKFAPGYVRRASFADVASLIHVVSAEPEIVDLYVFRSYADFVWEWLLKTASEASRLHLFGPQPTPPV